MKTFKAISLFTISMAFTAISFAQKAKTESIPVSGNCGMCKNNIEKAAKKAGASEAEWDVDAKALTVKYNSSTTNAAKIQESIAAVGYDTRDVKATKDAYDKLHGCCKYDRTESTNNDGKQMDCCKDGKCSKPGHDGKNCCEKSDVKMDCCKDGKCSKPGHDGKNCCEKSNVKMDCCKDGKCSKPGHDGNNCCNTNH